MNRILFALLVGAWFAPALAAADPAADLRDRGLVALEQARLDARTLGRVLNLAAHPDDEDGATLALCRHGRGMQAFAVFGNRGEGGQNEIGPELYRELGAIRERETVRATAREGATPLFLGLEDFGYSKTAEETFRFWGRERTVERVVYAVRRLRPDVVFTNHDPDTGHGQHRALAIAMREAFDLAADPKAFPEHFADGLTIWAPTLYLERVSASRGNADDPEKIPESELVRLDTDVVDPVRGTTFRQQAHDALKEHASQGRWTRFGRGQRTWRVIRRRHESFLRVGEDPFDATNLTRLRLFRAIDAGDVPRGAQSALLDPAAFTIPLDGDRDHLAGALLARRDALPEVESGPLSDDLDGLRRRIDRAAAAALGVRYVTAPERDQELGPVEATRLRVDRPEWIVLPDGFDPAAPILTRYGTRTAFTEPLWASPRYDAFDPTRADTAVETSLVHARSGRTLTVRSMVPDHARPPVTADFAPRTRVLLAGEGGDAAASIEALLLLEVTEPLTHAVEARLGESDDAAPPLWTGTLPTDVAGNHMVPVRFSWPGPPGRRPPLVLSAPGVASLQPLHVTVLDARVSPDLRVGVVRSYDDTLEAALLDLGVEARRLTSDDLAFRDLGRYDAILVDIRAYLVRDDLLRFNDRLLEYAEGGGTVAIFYQKTAEWNRNGDQDPGLAPFPLRLTRSRVVDQNAPVSILAPDHPLLSRPNQITPRDFDGWVHERGLYFPHESYGPEWAELLSCHDVGEKPLPGGLLVARTGAGWYVYTSYGWYRQWRAGVPGAYRFLANLISQPRQPSR